MSKFNSVEEVKNELIRILNKVVKDKKSGKEKMRTTIMIRDKNSQFLKKGRF